jgi:hypothetical protein
MKVTCFTSAITSFGLRTALISLVAACTGQGHRCIEHERTIEHGIYGEVAYRTLDGGDTPLYQVQMSLTDVGGAATRTTETNEDGLYEFALPNVVDTSFTLASTFANAPTRSVTVTDLARRDLVIEEGQIFWDENKLGECP